MKIAFTYYENYIIIVLIFQKFLCTWVHKTYVWVWARIKTLFKFVKLEQIIINIKVNQFSIQSITQLFIG
jgi:hypothetical protein